MHNNSSSDFAKNAVIIVAAGRGVRAGGGQIPKQYQKIGNQSILAKTLACFKGFENICVVIHPDDQALFEQACEQLPSEQAKPFFTFGGPTRSASVANGLDALKPLHPQNVLIHDAARPFLTSQTIQSVIDGLNSHQACVPCLPIADALKTLAADAVDRNQLRRVQTPQGFHYLAIQNAFNAAAPNQNYADDIEIAKEFGLSIKMSDGDADNIKITYATDLQTAQNQGNNNLNMISISASGYDVHRICSGKTLWLCGVEIEAGFSLKGHSDADVALHAITDAVFGAIADGDIGQHFPPSDEKWRGASSDQFLAYAIERTQEQSAILDHIDVTIICEKPKIGQHRQAMRERLAQISGLSINRISVKATTTEKLGFTGRGEGIAAQAMVSIRIPDDVCS